MAIPDPHILLQVEQGNLGSAAFFMSLSDFMRLELKGFLQKKGITFFLVKFLLLSGLLLKLYIQTCFDMKNVVL